MLSDTIAAKRAVSAQVDCSYEESVVLQLSDLCGKIFACVGDLQRACAEASAVTDPAERSKSYESKVLSAMGRLRAAVDAAEALTAKSYWPVPSYGDMLFSVK